MYPSFEFHLPTKIHFGFNKINLLGSLPFNVKRAFIVTDKGVLNSGLIENVTKILEDSQISYVVFDEVEPDPSVETIHKAAQVFQREEADALIAIGGGSPIDTAKSVRVITSNGGSIRDYAGVNLIKEASNIPLIAIPTTSGTGSEVTIFAVLSDWEENRKITVTSPYVAPDICIVDPKMTMTVPSKITAASGFDAFAHGAETFVSRISQPASDSLALSAMRTISRYLRRAVYNGEDIEARIKMAEASLLAGMAFNQSYLGLTHAVGSALSGHAHVSHGVAIGLLLPGVIRYNSISRADKYVEMASVFEDIDLSLPNWKIINQLVEEVTRLRDDVGLPQRLQDAGVKEDQLRAIADDSVKSGMWKFNPRRASVEEILELLRQLY
ncbi:iron-containing alcohol dehydrogenase family protein [Neobacillus mesonae]|uniref:iron-containing alcohol dehydrogenase family protein n=1 Tax=Neobacillus mesonae TaxID=1193713 RepID=UPI002040886B|nr:iron-containing alcohol dehydrogenase [Neobacillus mesonae]MCM3569687.1 iron-containing alcohol dehydrogenase [Neobacillus mesonae]